jgi:hypothetical protein
VDYYLADKPYQFELMLVSPCGLANRTGEAPELGSDNGIVNTLTCMADVDGTSSNHTFFQELLIWLISLHVRRRRIV